VNELDASVVNVGLTEHRQPWSFRRVASPQSTDFRLYDDVISEAVGRRVGVGGQQVVGGDGRGRAVDDRQAWTLSHKLERFIIDLQAPTHRRA